MGILSLFENELLRIDKWKLCIQKINRGCYGFIILLPYTRTVFLLIHKTVLFCLFHNRNYVQNNIKYTAIVSILFKPLANDCVDRCRLNYSHGFNKDDMMPVMNIGGNDVYIVQVLRIRAYFTPVTIVSIYIKGWKLVHACAAYAPFYH